MRELGRRRRRIRTSTLEGSLGVITTSTEGPAKNKIGLDLAPAGGGSVAEFSCGSKTFVTRGSVIVPVSANKMGTAETLKFAQKSGVQTSTHFENEGNDVLETSIAGGGYEQTGLAALTTLTSEEKVEINSVV